MKKLVAYIRTHTFFKLVLAFISTLTSSLLLLGVFSYYSYRSSLLEDAIASSRTSVSFIMERLDGEIKTLHYAALSVLSNDTLKNFDSYSKEPMPDAMFRLKKMMKEIAYLENSFLPLESLWLYNSAGELFITRYGSFDRAEFLEKRVSLQLSSGAPLEESLTSAGPFRYICTTDMASYYDAACILTFFRSTTDYQNRTSGQMILNVKRSTFTDILDKAGLRKELTVLLLDENGGLICASQNVGALTECADEALTQIMQADANSANLTLNGKPYTGWVTRSAESGLQYLALIDQQTLLQNVNYIRLVTLGLAALCIIASAILAFCFTTRMFAPIRKIIRYIQAEQGAAKGYQDVQLIESFIDYMESQNQQLQQSIDSYTALVEEAALTELLYSREQPMMDLYRKANLLPAFSYDYFTVAILPLSDPGGSGLGEAVEKLALQEPFSSGLVCRKIQQNERLILVFNAKAAGEEPVRCFLDTLAEKTGDSLLYAYGKTYPALSKVYDSFHQALNILMVKPQPPESGKAAYEEALNASYITSFYPQELELKLIRQIKSKDFEDGPHALLLDLFEKNSEGGAALLRLESLFIQLIMTINRIVVEMQLDGTAIFGKDVNQYRVLEGFSAEEEKKQYILNTFRKLSDYIRSSRTSKSAEIYQHMLDYIEEHYAEDLSLNELSYQLSLSPSYLSSIFKEYHHGTFLEYLNRYRIAKAKPLLLQTEDSVMAIARQVGYTNVNTFIRIFKKEEGITPGQYRMR